jgi:hypothetical protein
MEFNDLAENEILKILATNQMTNERDLLGFYYNFIGFSLYNTNEKPTDDEIHCYETSLFYGYPGAAINLIFCYRSLKIYDKFEIYINYAVNVLRETRVLQIIEDNYRINNPEKAEYYYNIFINNKCYEAYDYMIYLYLKKDPVKARKYMYLSLKHNNHKSYSISSAVYTDDKQYIFAKKHINKYLKYFPPTANIYMMLLEYYLWKKNMKKIMNLIKILNNCNELDDDQKKTIRIAENFIIKQKISILKNANYKKNIAECSMCYGEIDKYVNLNCLKKHKHIYCLYCFQKWFVDEKHQYDCILCKNKFEVYDLVW